MNDCKYSRDLIIYIMMVSVVVIAYLVQLGNKTVINFFLLALVIFLLGYLKQDCLLSSNVENYVDAQTYSIPNANEIPIVQTIPTFSPEEYGLPLDMGYNINENKEQVIEKYYPATIQAEQNNYLDGGIYDVMNPLNILPGDEKYIRKNANGSKKKAISLMHNKLTRNELAARKMQSEEYIKQINRRTLHNDKFDYIAGFQG